MATGVKELKLWQEAVALAGEVVRVARTAARRETKSFTDRLIECAVAVATHVAEGYGGHEGGEERRLFQLARRSLAELETHLAVARHAGIIPAAVLAQLTPRTATVGRLLAGYLAFIDRQRDAGQRPPGDLPLRIAAAEAVEQ
jgi:four helix bundle protein